MNSSYVNKNLTSDGKSSSSEKESFKRYLIPLGRLARASAAMGSLSIVRTLTTWETSRSKLLPFQRPITRASTDQNWLALRRKVTEKDTSPQLEELLQLMQDNRSLRGQ